MIPAILLLALPLSRWMVLVSSGEPITDELKQRLTYMPLHTHSDGLLVGVLIAYAFVMKGEAFRALPVAASAMYVPEVRANSDAQRVRIDARR